MELTDKIEDYILTPLTKREIELMELISQGKTNVEISNCMVIEEITVKTHLNNIYSKMNFSINDKTTMRLQAVLIWQKFRHEVINKNLLLTKNV